MTSLARIRPSLRRAAFVAALGALMVPATAGAAVHAEASAKKKKVKLPVVTKVSPLKVEIGQTLEVRGRYFIRGRNKNTVVFKRTGGKAVFVKAAVGTTKLLRLTLPAKLQKEFVTRGTTPLPTRFRIRVLAKKFGKKYTASSRSPVISLATPPPPPGFVESQPDGDCDGDGTKNATDNDDDNDGLTDSVEQSLNLNPCKGDTDEDGVEDKYEFDCDRNGILNRDETDDDKDLLSDTQEGEIGTNPCAADTDGDGVEDGYEYQSARDLNDDEDQTPNDYLPYPGKRPYPNPLFSDANVDYDGDSLTLAEEYRLWKFTYAITGTDQRTLTPLSYSDGEQYSRSTRVNGHRVPTLKDSNPEYDKRAQFVAWANLAHYRNVNIQGGLGGDPWAANPNRHDILGLFNTDRSDDSVDPNGESPSELSYNDINGDHYLSDDERDEDADGLTNYDETHGRMSPDYWKGCYTFEKPFHIAYAGTDVADEDSDGDGVRDGADDQDHDDIPNLNELSRIDASHIDDTEARTACSPRKDPKLGEKVEHPDAYGRVNPFNPCLPARFSRTCPKYFNSDTGAPFDGSPNWYSLQ
jgi:hypothetical protein